MNIDKILKNVESPYLKSGIPAFRPGDTVKVHVKVVEGESERIQPFEGVVLSRRGHSLSESFTVRKISFGVGIERTFPLHSPRITKIEIVRSSHARRAKLYYLRKLTGKAARLTEKEEKEAFAVAGPQHESPEVKAKPEPGAETPKKKTKPEPAAAPH